MKRRKVLTIGKLILILEVNTSLRVKHNILELYLEFRKVRSDDLHLTSNICKY